MSASRCLLSRICLSGLLCLALVTSLSGQSSHELRAVLNRLSGQWEGDAVLHTLDGREIGSFRLRRTYSWSGDVLEWQSVLELPSGPHRIRGRYFVRLGRLYATVSRPGQPAQDYTGTFLQGGIFWESALRNHRDQRETVEITEQGLFLDFESFELLGLDTIPGVVRIRSRLSAIQNSDSAVESTQPESQGTEWLTPADPIDSLRVYAPEDLPGERGQAEKR